MTTGEALGNAEPIERETEESRVLHWREFYFERWCGVQQEIAAVLAGAHVDTHELEALVNQGCPPSLAARILY